VSHKHFCEIGGHEWECECAALHEFDPERFQVCICKACQLPMDEGDHSNCPIELLTCPEHLSQKSAEESARGVPITFPPDVNEKAERAFQQLETYEAACFWCGHGYEDYNTKAEDEHFAYHCPDAPVELRNIARASLAGSAVPEGEE
jgi:hypothetical protein